MRDAGIAVPPPASQVEHIEVNASFETYRLIA